MYPYGGTLPIGFYDPYTRQRMLANGGHTYQGTNPSGQGMDVTYIPQLADPKTGMIPEMKIVADAPEGVQAARRMMAMTEPYYNFMNAQDMPFFTKVRATLFPESYKQHPPYNCINTATYAITQGPTVANNDHLYANPERP